MLILKNVSWSNLVKYTIYNIQYTYNRLGGRILPNIDQRVGKCEGQVSRSVQLFLHLFPPGLHTGQESGQISRSSSSPPHYRLLPSRYTPTSWPTCLVCSTLSPETNIMTTTSQSSVLSNLSSMLAGSRWPRHSSTHLARMMMISTQTSLLIEISSSLSY